jgi:hypothetical protein
MSQAPVATEMRIDQQAYCTCQRGRLCRQRGHHVLGGPSPLGYRPWVRGVNICSDCDAVEEDHARSGD